MQLNHELLSEGALQQDVDLQRLYVELVEGKLSPEELELVKKFEKECFGSKDWNHRR